MKARSGRRMRRTRSIAEGSPSSPSTLARAVPSKLAPEGVVFAAASHVQARVESLLRDEPGGERLSLRLSIAAAFASVGLAIVLSSTALNMLALPALYARFARKTTSEA